MENFFTLLLCMFPFIYFYIRSIRIKKYFTNSSSTAVLLFSVFVFTYLVITVLLIFLDVITTSTNKEFLNFKERFALKFLMTFEVAILLVAPTLYLYYILQEEKVNTENKENKENCKGSIQYYFSIYLLYLAGLLCLNVFHLKLSPFLYNIGSNNNGFSEKVPEGLASYAKIEGTVEKLIYFNFGLLMMVGKFLGFTYMPYGMSKFVYDLIYPDEQLNTREENEQSVDADTPPLHFAPEDMDNEKRPLILPVSSEENFQRSFFTNANANANNKSACDEVNMKQQPVEEQLEKSKSDGNEANNQSLITVEEFLAKFPRGLSSNGSNTSSSTSTGIVLNSWLIYTLPVKYFSRILCISFIITSIILIFFILYTKIAILYIKLSYNICGTDCGLLAYRFDDIFTLETVTSYLSQSTQNMNLIVKLDFLFFAFLLLFRMLTVIKSFSIKGISFMWVVFQKPSRDMSAFHIIQIYTTILFTGVVLIYDFTYLLPDFIRFNGLDPVCDYSLIMKSYCGVSYYGLLFIKISMNYHVFMYWDIIASGVFITNGIIWAFRLIVKPLVESGIHKLIYKQSSSNEKLSFI